MGRGIAPRHSLWLFHSTLLYSLLVLQYQNDKQDLIGYVRNLGKAAEIRHRKYLEQEESQSSENINTNTIIDQDEEGVALKESSIAVADVAEGDAVLSLDTVSSAAEKKQMELEALKANTVVLVTPGPIIYMFQEIDGSYDAMILNFNHPLFQRMNLLFEHAVEDHKMMNYRAIIDSLRYMRMRKGDNASSEDGGVHKSLKRLRKTCSLRVNIGASARSTKHREIVRSQQVADPLNSCSLSFSFITFLL